MSIYFDFSIFNGEYFDFSIIAFAAVVGILTAVCAVLLGTHLVLKRYSMIGDGLSHVGFFALSLAAVMGVSNGNTAYVTVPIVIIAAFLLMRMSESGKIKGDSATALVSTGAVALGYILFSIAKSGAGDVCAGLFGASILTLNASDLWLSIVLSAIVLITYILIYNKIFSATFDEEFSSAAGISVKGCNLILAVLTAITVVAGMKLIGSIMISALIVIPAITAMKLYKSFKAVIISAVIISLSCFILGFIFAVTFVVETAGGVVMLPVGATIVVFDIISLFGVSIYKKSNSRRCFKNENRNTNT